MSDDKATFEKSGLKLSHRFGILAGIFMLGFSVFGAVALSTFNELKVNGPVYDRVVQGKDLVADILPPPNYVIESYLNVLEAAGKKSRPELEKIAARIEVLRAEYNTRREYWQKATLGPELQTAFVELANAPVGRFYELTQKTFLPALIAGDQKSADAALNDIRALYEQHREAIDKTVVLVNARNEATEKSAAAAISSRLIFLSFAFALSLAGVVILCIDTARRIFRQIGGEPARAAQIARQVSVGNLSEEIPLRADDQTSILSAMANMQKVLRTFVSAQEEMNRHHDLGKTSYRIDDGQFEGKYREMAQLSNELVASHIKLKMRIVKVVGQYAKGDLSVDMEQLPGEKAQITVAVNEVKTSLKAISEQIRTLVDAAAHGDFSIRGDEQQFDFEFRKMVAGLNELMQTSDQGLSEVSRVLGALAKGDLTDKINASYQGVFGRLKDDCNQTVENLTNIVNQIKDSSVSIDTAAREISQGNTDLSSRTEEQASSLQETASSMEELTAAVKQNAENAMQANQLAVSASETAVNGGDVVRQVVSTMSDISASSNKIVEIIGTIDGIAFQTNILALNAAVEAARAGEQGRGFAVVASEVRNLAQRSAAAAKEIKALITESVNNVQIGSKLVEDAGQNMDGIVDSVKRVTDIMAEITAASQEQSSGIEQVNQAITQMDEVTQQNAALVEEAAAAAESMQDQSGALVQAVSTFKLGRESEAHMHTHSLTQTRSAAGKPSRMPSGAKPGIERRGPNRAANVARLPAKNAEPDTAANRAGVAHSSSRQTSLATDDWEEF